MNDAIENLDYWLKLHRLPAHFPLLGVDTVPPPTDPFLREGGEEMKRIIDQVLGSFRSMIVVPPGQGTTTFLREMIRKLRASEFRLYDLFIYIDVAALATAEYLNEALEKTIREEVFRQLASQGWVRTLRGPAKQALLYCFDMAHDKEMFDMENGLGRGDAATETRLQQIAERQEGKLAELIRRLHGEMGFTTRLCFDFPHTASDDTVLEIFREVKWFDENDKGDGFPPSALREIYLLTRQQANLARTVWSVDFSEHDIRSYNTGEVFSILDHHYRPSMGSRSYSLINALSDEFVARVWQDSLPLAEMSQQLKQEMLQALDIPRGKIPYQLTPVAK